MRFDGYIGRMANTSGDDKNSSRPPTPVTPLDDEFLAENRRNRERIREEERQRARRHGYGEDREIDEAGAEEQAAEPGAPSAAGGSPHSRKLVRALFVGVVALAVAVAILGYLLADSGSDENEGVDRDGAIRDAKAYSVDILTYQAGRYDDLDRRIRAISTPEFADRYVKSSQEARKANDAAQASSTASADVAGIVSITGDEAVVLVALDQEVTTPQAPAMGPGSGAYQSRIQVTLIRDDGMWRLSELEPV